MTTHEDTTNLRPPARFCDPEIDRLLHPGRFYDRPGDVLIDASLTYSERRAILSAWASDACAIDSAPTLRHPPFASRPVTFEEIMDALMALDRLSSQRPMTVWTHTQRRSPQWQGIDGKTKRTPAPMPAAGMNV